MLLRSLIKSLWRDPRSVAVGLLCFLLFILICKFFGEWWGVIFGWAAFVAAIGWVSWWLRVVRKEIENDPFDGWD